MVKHLLAVCSAVMSTSESARSSAKSRRLPVSSCSSYSLIETDKFSSGYFYQDQCLVLIQQITYPQATLILTHSKHTSTYFPNKGNHCTVAMHVSGTNIYNATICNSIPVKALLREHTFLAFTRK